MILNLNITKYYNYITNNPTKTHDKIRSLLENIWSDSDFPKKDRGSKKVDSYQDMQGLINWV